MIFKTRRAAAGQRRKHETIVPVISAWKRCEIGCHCIPVAARRIGWALVLGLALTLGGCASQLGPEATDLRKDFQRAVRAERGNAMRVCRADHDANGQISQYDRAQMAKRPDYIAGPPKSRAGTDCEYAAGQTLNWLRRQAHYAESDSSLLRIVQAARSCAQGRLGEYRPESALTVAHRMRKFEACIKINYSSLTPDR